MMMRLLGDFGQPWSLPSRLRAAEAFSSNDGILDSIYDEDDDDGDYDDDDDDDDNIANGQALLKVDSCWPFY